MIAGTANHASNQEMQGQLDHLSQKHDELIRQLDAGECEATLKAADRKRKFFFRVKL